MTVLKEIVEAIAALILFIATIWAGLKFNRTVQENKQIRADLDTMKEEVKMHHESTDRHLVPGREDKILELIRVTLSEALTGFRDELKRIDRRCEDRREDCTKHFGKIEQRIAAQTGKINGD